MKLKSALFSIMIAAFALALMANGFLFVQNKTYKNKNRELIIQNDSILSANLELKKAVETQNNTTQNLTLRSKTGKK